jgi:hypothetical protein
MKKATQKTAVIIVMTLSAPRSLVLVKIFILLPPITAADAPSDFPDWSKVIMIMMNDNTNSTICAAVVILTSISDSLTLLV